MTKDEPLEYLLGASLRKARTEAKLTQANLAQQAGWKESTGKSKVSKTESGEQVPDADDLERWARATGVDARLLDQWKILAAEEDARRNASYKNRLKGGQAPVQQEWTKRAEESTRFRFFETFVVPRYLQVPEYTRATLEEFKTFSSVDDLDAAVKVRQASTRLLYDPDKSFQLIIDEPVLRRKRFPRSVMRPQLLFLQSVIGEEDQLRIYPSLSRRVSKLTPSSFELFDNLGYIETAAGGAKPLLYDTVAQLERTFDELWSEAVGGDAAREIIALALKELPAN